MHKYPDVVHKLVSFEAPDGSQLLSAADISDILYNCKETIEINPKRISEISISPEDTARIASSENKGVAFAKICTI